MSVHAAPVENGKQVDELQSRQRTESEFKTVCRPQSALPEREPREWPRMRNYRLDVADVHAGGDGAGAFLGAVLAELDV